jgi:hypothetical protein
VFYWDVIPEFINLVVFHWCVYFITICPYLFLVTPCFDDCYLTTKQSMIEFVLLQDMVFSLVD